MNEREALKLALEALKDFLNPLHTDLMLDINRVDQKTRLAITAIREALAQPEHSCVACEGNPKGNNNPCAVCGMAQPEQEPVAYVSDIEFDEETAIIPAEKKGSLGTAGLKIPLYIAPQPKALADAYLCGFNMGQKAAEIMPPKQQWVDLTEDELEACEYNDNEGLVGREEFVRAVIAKLKEKNT